MPQYNTILQDLFDHNDWANAKLFQLCAGLTDEQLDQPREMGFGTLRNTVFHNLEAEKLWLERWQGLPWRPLQADANGRTISAIAEEARAVAEQRNALLQQESESDFARVVKFQDLKQREYEFPIGVLINHVTNHGIHHRAQALSYLKQFEVTVPGGLDYLFWKIAYSSCGLPEESIAPLSQFGLETQSGPGTIPKFDRKFVQSYFTYNDWAMDHILAAAGGLSAGGIEEEFGLGAGSLQKNIQHMIDAERWWVANWQQENAPFPHGEDPRSLVDMQSLLDEVRKQRNDFIEGLDSEAADRIVHITAGGPVSCFRVTESLLQLCGHGTHHRAQCLNMLRQAGCTPPPIDLIVWLRENASQFAS